MLFSIFSGIFDTGVNGGGVWSVCPSLRGLLYSPGDRAARPSTTKKRHEISNNSEQ